MSSRSFFLVLALVAIYFAAPRIAQAQAHHATAMYIGCRSPVCVGQATHCVIDVAHSDTFGDTTQIVEAFDIVDPISEDNPGGSNIRVPSVGNLPIAAAIGNTTCTVGGSLPCLLGPAGSTLSGLPGADQPAVVTFRSEYVIQADDPTTLTSRGTARVRDLCDSPATTGCSTGINTVQFSAGTQVLQCAPCPSGSMAWLSPPSGAVDARQPFPPGKPHIRQGIQTITANGPAGAPIVCWSLCESGYPETSNTIGNIVESPDGTYTITLIRPITSGAATTLKYTPTNGTPSMGVYIAHPGNVNSDSTTAPSDIIDLVDHLNGVRNPPLAIWQCDIDRSGLCAPADILGEIDLLNGVNEFQVWNGTPKPTTLCP